MTPRRLLITGAAGALGGSVLRHLDVSSWNEVRLLTHRRQPPPGPWVPRPGNLEDPESLDRDLDGIHTVFHLAGRTHSHREYDYRRVNVLATGALLDAAERAGVERFLRVSTTAAHPQGGAYARSKLESEELVKQSSLPWSILCPAEVYGPGAGGFVNRLAKWVQRWGLAPMPGYGKEALTPVHLEDACVALVRALKCDEVVGRRVVLAGPERVSLKELIARAGRAAGRRGRAIPVPWSILRLASRMARWLGSEALVEDQIQRLRCPRVLDSVEAAAALDFTPRPLDKGLEDLASWYGREPSA